MSKRTAALDVGAYLQALPPEQRTTLEKVRKLIMAAAPDAEEVISYQVPSYKQHGMLVGFAAFKDHCSFFVMSPKLMPTFKDDLKAYSTATATIHFANDKPLPATLVKKIVKARLAENAARVTKKAATRKRAGK